MSRDTNCFVSPKPCYEELEFFKKKLIKKNEVGIYAIKSNETRGETA